MGAKEEANKQRVREFMQAFEDGDQQKIRSMLAPEARIWTGGSLWFSGERGVDEMFDQSKDLFAQFPNGIKFIMKRYTAEDDRVAAELESDGPHVNGGVYHNFYHFLWVFRDDGKIVEFKEYLDTALAEKFVGERIPAALRGRRA